MTLRESGPADSPLSLALLRLHLESTTADSPLSLASRYNNNVMSYHRIQDIEETNALNFVDSTLSHL